MKNLIITLCLIDIITSPKNENIQEKNSKKDKVILHQPTE